MFFINLDKEYPTRFDPGKFMKFEQNSHDTLTSYFRKKISGLPLGGYFHVTAEIGRPDLVCYKIYKKTELWWLLLLYNELAEPDQITAGMTLNYPTVTSIEDLYFSLRSKERANI